MGVRVKVRVEWDEGAVGDGREGGNEGGGDRVKVQEVNMARQRCTSINTYYTWNPLMCACTCMLCVR